MWQLPGSTHVGEGRKLGRGISQDTTQVYHSARPYLGMEYAQAGVALPATLLVGGRDAPHH